VNLELDTVSERSEIEDEDGGEGSDQVGLRVEGDNVII
jgi:hypothetical protein